jgi:hypothetical protein
VLTGRVVPGGKRGGDGGHELGCGPGAEPLVQLPPPGGALVGQGSRGLLVAAGFQGGLLGELPADGVRRVVPMSAAVAGEEGVVAGLDGGAAAGEVRDHRGRDAVDLADGVLAVAAGAGAGGEPDPQGGGEARFEGGVVALGRGDAHA